MPVRAVMRTNLIECWQLESMQVKLRQETVPGWVTDKECDLVYDDSTSMLALANLSTSPTEKCLATGIISLDGDYLLYDTRADFVLHHHEQR